MPGSGIPVLLYLLLPDRFIMCCKHGLHITQLFADGGGVAEEQVLGGQEGPLRGALQEGAVRADQEAARYAGAGLQDVPLQDGRLQPQGECSRQLRQFVPGLMAREDVGICCITL
jgi:hypothetical protein